MITIPTQFSPQAAEYLYMKKLTNKNLGARRESWGGTLDRLLKTIGVIGYLYQAQKEKE